MFEENRYAIIADGELKKLEEHSSDKYALEWLDEWVEVNKTNGEYEEIQLVELKIVKGVQFDIHKTAEVDCRYGKALK